MTTMAEDRVVQTRAVADQARELLRQNRPEEAARLLREHLTSHAGLAAEEMLLGVALAQAGENAAAIETLERSVALEPGNAATHFNLGQIYRQAGRREEAL